VRTSELTAIANGAPPGNGADPEGEKK
jgi:hypothetical protein